MKADKKIWDAYFSRVRSDDPIPGIRRTTRYMTEASIEALTHWRSIPDRYPDDAYPYQVMDLFCGCGGMTLGFAALSRIWPYFKIVGGCDIDPDAAKTYRYNFGVPVAETDIRNIASNKKTFDRFLHEIKGYDSSKPLVVIGCAPCQGFSSHRKKDWDRKDGRNTLVASFSNVAVKLTPECIVMENVPELLSVKYWNHFQSARKILEKAGYVVRQSIYNAAAFGVPQERFRSVVIAMRKDFLLPKPLYDPKEYTTVRHAIGHLPFVEPGHPHPKDPLHRSARHRQETLDVIRAVPKNGGSRPFGVGPKCLDRVKGFSDVYGRLYWDSPSITITHYSRNPASGRYIHPEQDRGFTMREAALLQSFPVGFEFKGSFDSVFKQIGEAVPPRLSCGVAASVLTELLSPPPDDGEKKAGVPSITEPVSSSYSSVIAGIKARRRVA